MNLHIISAVASEPVELVHDAELHPGRSDEREHVLEAVAIRRPGRLTSVHELPHDPDPEFISLALVRFALGGDREVFVGAATFGLLPCGDSQVGDGQ